MQPCLHKAWRPRGSVYGPGHRGKKKSKRVYETCRFVAPRIHSSARQARATFAPGHFNVGWLLKEAICRSKKNSSLRTDVHRLQKNPAFSSLRNAFCKQRVARKLKDGITTVLSCVGP